MDCFGGKKKSYNNKLCEKNLRGVAEKVRLLQEEIKAIVCEREKESRAYERDMMFFEFKKGEWKQERKKFKEEVKRLKKMLEEKEEKIEGMADGLLVGEENEKNLHFSLSWNASFLVEQMKEERVRRDEAVDKWKKLYLAIKTELDDLIQRTHRGNGLYWKAEEEDMIEELKMEVKAKDGTIEKLKARLALVEHEEYKKAREFDILRQSLRIMSSKNSPSYAPNKPLLAVLVKQPRKV